MQKLLRASLLIATLSVLLLIGGSSVAQAQTGTVSPYTTAPTCPLAGQFPKTCTYPNGDTARCDSSTTGFSTILTCTNPDRSTSVCNVSADIDETGGNRDSSVQRSCRVTNADGTSGGEVTEVNDDSGITSTTTDSAGNNTVTTNERTFDPTCSMGNLPQCFMNIPGMLFTGIAFLFLTLSGFILGLAGTVFNWVVIRTVFQFGTYFGTNEGMLIAWGVMRDVANIGLLFGFILMGVLLILNVDGGGGHGHGHGGGISAKKAIPRLIIFAVLLNFSLFASQLVIDVANAFSSSFATLAGESCSTNTSTGTTADGTAESNQDCANIGIAGQVLKVTGLTALWDTEALDIETGMRNLADRPYSYAVSLIMLSIFVLITAMVLLAGAILLIIRVVILSLLMVTSPVGFAGMAIPKLQGIATMWWSKLMSQAFFAPVYLLLIFISIKLTEGLTEGNATLANALIANQGNSVAGNMQVVMVFLIVIGFMIGSLIAATKLGAMGAKFATSTAAGMTVGGVAWAGRRSVGVASSKAAERIRSSRIGSSETGRLLAGVADYGAKANYDLRSTKAAGAIKGVDLGKPQKGGYDAIVHHATEEREKYGKSLSQTKEDKAAEDALKKEKKGLEEGKKREKDLWTAEEQTLKARITETEETNKVAMAERIQARGVQEMKLKAALDSGNGEKAQEEEAALAALTSAHNDAAKVEREATAAAREALRAREGAHKNEVSAADARIKAIDNEIKGEVKDGHVISTGVGGNAAGYRYAQDLHRTQTNPTNTFSAGGRAGHHAAESIVKNANKSKIEKSLDALKEATEKTDSEKAHDNVEADHDGGTKKAADGHGH